MGFRVQVRGLGFEVWGLRFGVLVRGLWFRVSSSQFCIRGSGLGFEVRVRCLGFGLGVHG